MSDAGQFQADVKQELQELARLGIRDAGEALARFKSRASGQTMEEGYRTGMSVTACADLLRDLAAGT